MSRKSTLVGSKLLHVSTLQWFSGFTYADSESLGIIIGLAEYNLIAEWVTVIMWY